MIKKYYFIIRDKRDNTIKEKHYSNNLEYIKYLYNKALYSYDGEKWTPRALILNSAIEENFLDEYYYYYS